MDVFVIDVGDDVLCDFCGEDYSRSEATGGVIFQTKAVCPVCSKKLLEDANKFGEARLVRAVCRNGETFADFVRRIRA